MKIGCFLTEILYSKVKNFLRHTIVCLFFIFCVFAMAVVNKCRYKCSYLCNAKRVRTLRGKMVSFNDTENRWTGDVFTPNHATVTDNGCYTTSFSSKYDCNGSFDDVITDADKPDIMYEFYTSTTLGYFIFC